jgi:hypothetical protein
MGAMLLSTACGGSEVPSVQTPASPSPVGPTATVRINEQGFDPTEVQVTVGTRVVFVNAGSRLPEIYSGLDHVSFECLEVDVVGLVTPGASRQTRVFESPRTCAFHDATNLGNQSFQGRIIVR